MANGLPPPPLKNEVGDFAWLDWYNKLYRYVGTAGSFLWSNIDFTGSKLSDIQTRQHNSLQSLQGGTAGEYYHLTSAQRSNVASLPNITGNANGLIVQTKAGNPNTTDIPAGQAAIYKNTTLNTVSLWVNDGGTMKSVVLL